MNEQQPQDAAGPQDQPEIQAPAPDAPRNRAERRHGAAADHHGNSSMPGKRGSFAGPFHAPGPGHKRPHSHRKTG